MVSLDVGPVGNGTRRNLAAHDDVTLVWPPNEPGGYTLIVDGTRRPNKTRLTVVPSRAVLHRKALPGTATEPGCKDDCVPLEG